MMKKYYIILGFFFSFIITEAQQHIGFNISTGINWWKMSSVDYSFVKEGYGQNSYIPSLFNSHQLDVYYVLNKDITIQVGYTSFLETTHIIVRQAVKIQQPLLLTQIPITISTKKQLYKGLNVCLKGGLVFNNLKNRFENGAVIEDFTAEISNDSLIVFNNFVNAKRNITVLPQLGVQIQYEFKNGLKIFFLSTRMFGFNLGLTKSESYYKVNDQRVDIKSNSVKFDQVWTRFGVGIPIYHIDRNKEQPS